MEHVKVKDMRVAIGGLMRCCTATLDKMYEEEPERELVEGERINCMYENKPTMKVEGGIVQWIGYEEAVHGRNE